MPSPSWTQLSPLALPVTLEPGENESSVVPFAIPDVPIGRRYRIEVESRVPGSEYVQRDAVAEAAQGTQEASRSAVGVRQGAERTGGAAQDLKGASGELAQQSERLRGQVDTFLANIRAA